MEDLFAPGVKTATTNIFTNNKQKVGYVLVAEDYSYIVTVRIKNADKFSLESISDFIAYFVFNNRHSQYTWFTVGLQYSGKDLTVLVHISNKELLDLLCLFTLAKACTNTIIKL